MALNNVVIKPKSVKHGLNMMRSLVRFTELQLKRIRDMLFNNCLQSKRI